MQQQSFGKQYRLTKADEYSSVFALHKTKSLYYLRIYFTNNQLENSRLGLIVSKKIAKRAHERNYMKRCLREWFRKHKHELPNQDWIMHVKKKFEQKDYHLLIQQLDVYLLSIKKVYDKTSNN